MFHPHSRIDLVAHRRGRLLRVQVKSARVIGAVVTFHTCSNTGNVPRAYQGEIDVFGVYSPDLGTCYLVPIEEAPDRGCHLRLAPPRNNQVKGVRWAHDYEVRPALPG